MPSVPLDKGAAISKAVRYWLLTLPFSCTCECVVLGACVLSVRSCSKGSNWQGCEVLAAHDAQAVAAVMARVRTCVHIRVRLCVLGGGESAWVHVCMHVFKKCRALLQGMWRMGYIHAALCHSAELRLAQKCTAILFPPHLQLLSPSQMASPVH